MTSIVLAEDHSIVREGLRLLLSGNPNLRVIGEAADGLAAVELVERLQPDLLIVDVMMPGLNGLDVIRHSAQRSPRTAIIVLSMYADESYVLRALRLGALGYVLKNSSSTDLLKAIGAVLEGRTYLSSPLSERAVSAYVEKAHDRPEDPYESLTPREREVFKLVVEGHTTAGIAEQLTISPRTAEVHRINLMRKLGITNHTDLVRLAIKRGVISLDN